MVRAHSSMRRGTARTLLLGLFAAACVTGSSAAQEASFRYALVYSERTPDEVAVELRWKSPLDAPAVLVVPRSIPMGYGEQPYDRFLRRVEGLTASGDAIATERQEGPRWLVPAGAVAVRYGVDLAALERTVLSASDQSRVRDGYVGLLGYSVFGYLEGRRQDSVELSVDAPERWPIHSTLSPRWPVASGSIAARAANFYALADSQIVMGPRMQVQRLTSEPAALYLVSYAEGPVDLEITGELAATAYRRVLDYFGGAAPFEHYTMHLELLKPISPQHEYGFSMEHLDSSTYYLDASRGLTAESSERELARNLYNFAHHIVHSWVPKRAHGRGYFPFSWELAPVLSTIWFSEGFGQYAAIVAIAAGEEDPATYREQMLDFRFRSNLATAPQFLRELTLEELSHVASTRYGLDFRTGRLVFSRGGLMAAEVDERIEARSNGERDLRDALLHLVRWTRDHPAGFESVEQLIGLIREATGVDVGDVMERWLAPLPSNSP